MPQFRIRRDSMARMRSVVEIQRSGYAWAYAEARDEKAAEHILKALNALSGVKSEDSLEANAGVPFGSSTGSANPNTSSGESL